VLQARRQTIFRKPTGTSGAEGDMSFAVEADYVEVCNCDVSCNRVWLDPATQDHCDVLLAWHVTSGNKERVDLSGLNAVMAVHSPQRMADDGWSPGAASDDHVRKERWVAAREVAGAPVRGLAGVWSCLT
jgi:hypothetical protein